MILAMLEVQEQESSDSDGFDAEIHQRFKDYEEGKIVPITLEELETRVKKNHAQI